MTNKTHRAISISLILILAFFVRTYHHHHILMSDEAQNMLVIKALIEGEGFRSYFFIHPPLFIALSALVSYPFGDDHRIVQGLSIVFSTISIIPFCLIVQEIFDKRTAILSAFFLAVLPLNIMYSTWVKPEGMILFIFLLTFYLYMKGMIWRSGMMLGIASLTKEFAWFLAPIVLGWEVISGWERRGSLKRLFLWGCIGFALSAWWYLLLGGSFKIIGQAAEGSNLFEYIWHFPWYFYLRNLQVDLGITLIPFFIMGIFSMQTGRRLLPFIWVLTFYVVLSSMKVKAFWYPYLASPGMAIIVAIGFLKVWDMIMSKRLRFFVVPIFIFALALAIYNVDSGITYRMWIPIKNFDPIEFPEKEYLDSGRKSLAGDGKVAILSYNPTLQYYLGIRDERLLYFGPQFPAMNKDMLKEVVERRAITWVVIDIDSVYFVDKSASLLTELWGAPKKIGRLLIFKTDLPNPLNS